MIVIARGRPGHQMTFEEIDRTLASWNQRLAAIADNLLELQRDPTYQVLTGTAGAPPMQLTGETKRLVLPALKPLTGIFSQFTLLQGMIDRATQLRGNLPVFGRVDALREIEALLLDESIQLAPDAISLKDRTLLSGAQSRIRPEQLLASMAAAYGEARDAVARVSSAWDDLARELDVAETEMRRLEMRASAANCTLPAAFGYAGQTLDTLKAQIQSDPLAAQDVVRAQLMPALEAAARHLDVALRLHDQIAAAHERLARLRASEHELQTAAAASQGKILGGAPPDAPPPQSAGLADWLARLEHRTGDEPPQTIAHGLENWQRAADQATAQTSLALQQQRLPLEKRSELRGRLDALKAKARVYGVAEDASVAGLAAQAEQLLYARPTDLTRSAAAVEAYERRLSVPARTPQTQANGERR